MDCLFCKIIKGEIPSLTIYEDNIVKAFLDISPSTNGDLLIVPIKHYENVLDIDLNTITHIFNIVKNLFPLLKEKLNCDGLTLVQNNEYGQEIKHFHLHLTPRYKDDKLEHVYNKEILKDIDDIFNILTK